MVNVMIDGVATPEETTYRPRLIDAKLRRLFAALPAISLVGPRACGKTTTAARLAASIAHIDKPGVAALFGADPDAVLARQAEPVLLDEWQFAPGLLGAVKRAVDGGRGGGRFLLTGSADVDITAVQWPGTGRIATLPMYPMTRRELAGHVEGRLFVERATSGRIEDLVGVEPALDLIDYARLAYRGGFPEAIGLEEDILRAWLDSYIDHLVHRDAVTSGNPPDPARLSTFVEVLGLNSAGVVDDATLNRATGVTHATRQRYESLLTRLCVEDIVPAWTPNRLTGLTKMPKRYLIDSSLIAPGARVDFDTLIEEPALLGRLIDTFIAAQLRPELAICDNPPRLRHLRDQSGRHEVDLILEYSLGRIVAIEIKAAAAVSHHDARHLEWLRDRLGERFIAGIVLHTGPEPYPLADRICAAPISTLWA